MPLLSVLRGNFARYFPPAFTIYLQYDTAESGDRHIKSEIKCLHKSD